MADRKTKGGYPSADVTISELGPIPDVLTRPATWTATSRTPDPGAHASYRMRRSAAPMTDLDVQIRELLDDPKSFLENGIEPLIAAIRAVLDRHALEPGGGMGHEPDDNDIYGEMSRVCTSCGTPSEYAVLDPCPTKRDIAVALGIEVGRD
jgi:hypothetical protein